jgi:predicted nucleic acid-binding protein
MVDVTEIQKIVAVSNTGPLISTFQCGRTDLLNLYLSLTYITASELIEFNKHGWLDDIRKLIKDGLIIVIEQLTNHEREESIRLAGKIAEDPSSCDTNWQSHLPESEAMVLMLQRTHLMIDIIFLDGKAARHVAQELKIRIVGFPGLLARAELDGLLTQNEIRQLLKTCQQQGTHYSNHLIENVAQTYGR